jgi:hypothetical protein
MENHYVLIGKPSINGPFSMAILNNQRVLGFLLRLAVMIAVLLLGE